MRDALWIDHDLAFLAKLPQAAAAMNISFGPEQLKTLVERIEFSYDPVTARKALEQEYKLYILPSQLRWLVPDSVASLQRYIAQFRNGGADRYADVRYDIQMPALPLEQLVHELGLVGRPVLMHAFGRSSLEAAFTAGVPFYEKSLIPMPENAKEHYRFLLRVSMPQKDSSQFECGTTIDLLRKYFL